MRRGDLVNVGRSHAHQNLVNNTEFTLTYESAILIYLTFGIAFLHEGNVSENCTIHPKAHMAKFVMLVLWPTVLTRLIIYLKTRNVNYVTM